MKIRELGIHLMVVTIGKDYLPIQVNGIASGPDDQNVFKAPDFNSLKGLEAELLGILANGN